MFKLGLKLWSTNKKYVEDAVRLYENGFYSYIELFAIPNSFDDMIKIWQSLKIPYVIHAPHFSSGLNFSLRESLERNLILAKEALKFADELNADMIIFHPGIRGDLKETVHQLNCINDTRIVIENKPFWSLKNEQCVGYSPEQIKFICDNAKVRFCFDLRHAICAANAQKIDQLVYVKQFLTLNPSIFHLSDGDRDSIYDQHFHLGSGSLNLGDFLKFYPSTCMISIECIHDFDDRLTDFELDVSYLRKIEKALAKQQ